MTEQEYRIVQRLETLRAACRVLQFERNGDPHAAKAYATLQTGIRKIERALIREGTITDGPHERQ